MIELAFIVCLSATPTTCRDESLLFADVPLMTCFVQGQAQLAAWATHHPGWNVKRWSCQMHDPKSAKL